jgi:hypothetical protein
MPVYEGKRLLIQGRKWSSSRGVLGVLSQIYSNMYFLSKSVTPVEYFLTLDLRESQHFNGDVKIKVNVETETEQLRVHAKGFKYQQVRKCLRK